MKIFRDILLAFFVLFVLFGCGHKGDPIYIESKTTK